MDTKVLTIDHTKSTHHKKNKPSFFLDLSSVGAGQKTYDAGLQTMTAGQKLTGLYVP